MILQAIEFKGDLLRHVETFDGDSGHWDGTDKIRVKLRGAIRKHYLAQQDYHCAYCNRFRQDFHGYCWDIDHIIPKDTHPQFTYEPHNYALTCKDCNTKKGEFNVLEPSVIAAVKYPKNSNDYIIINPHFDDYSVHMAVDYNINKQVYHIPKTKKGTETFRMCNLSRFTEVIAKTSEVVEDENITIGFSDAEFRKIYINYKAIMNNNELTPSERKQRLISRLTELLGVDINNM